MINKEILETEEFLLERDREFYLECLNNKPLKDRKTEQEIRDGLILFWHVYVYIRNNQ
jgi:hypothetical protein